jgi:hypothetical protein
MPLLVLRPLLQTEIAERPIDLSGLGFESPIGIEIVFNEIGATESSGGADVFAPSHHAQAATQRTFVEFQYSASSIGVHPPCRQSTRHDSSNNSAQARIVHYWRKRQMVRRFPRRRLSAPGPISTLCGKSLPSSTTH